MSSKLGLLFDNLLLFSLVSNWFTKCCHDHNAYTPQFFTSTNILLWQNFALPYPIILEHPAAKIGKYSFSNTAVNNFSFVQIFTIDSCNFNLNLFMQSFKTFLSINYVWYVWYHTIPRIQRWEQFVPVHEKVFNNLFAFGCI